MKFAIPALLATALIALSACSEQAEEALMCVARPTPSFAAPPADPCDSFSASFALKNDSGVASNSFARGTPVTLELKITNNAATAKTLTTPDACPQVRLEVDSSNPSCLVYSSSAANMACGQALTTTTFAAGETKTFTSQWSQTNSRGAQVPAGGFTAYGIDRTQCAAKFYSSASFSVQ